MHSTAFFGGKVRHLEATCSSLLCSCGSSVTGPQLRRSHLTFILASAGTLQGPCLLQPCLHRVASAESKWIWSSEGKCNDWTI